MGSPKKKAPSGPYADKLWREALRRAVFKRVEKNQRLDLIADAVAAKAMEGDMAAAREIGDRLDGKATEHHEHNVSIGFSEALAAARERAKKANAAG